MRNCSRMNYNNTANNGSGNGSTNGISERQKLLRVVQAQDFILTDLALYLDTHPTCPHGLACYQAHKQLRDDAVAAFTAQFGPLCHKDFSGSWDWVNNPWPWELED